MKNLPKSGRYESLQNFSKVDSLLFSSSESVSHLKGQQRCKLGTSVNEQENKMCLYILEHIIVTLNIWKSYNFFDDEF